MNISMRSVLFGVLCALHASNASEFYSSSGGDTTNTTWSSSGGDTTTATRDGRSTVPGEPLLLVAAALGPFLFRVDAVQLVLSLLLLLVAKLGLRVDRNGLVARIATGRAGIDLRRVCWPASRG